MHYRLTVTWTADPRQAANLATEIRQMLAMSRIDADITFEELDPTCFDYQSILH